ncbi:MAG: metal-dependent phosphohydrolase [Spirochaetes bacterium]|nr:metal-dependent phosphohydrolase [Spirochaetota bacterium]
MADKISEIPVEMVLSQAPDISEKYLSLMLKEDVSVLCVNRSAKEKQSLPFRVLYEKNSSFWQQDENWEYFISLESFMGIREKSGGGRKKEADIPAIELGYGDEYEEIASMSDAERIGKLDGCSARLSGLLAKKSAGEEEVAEALVDATKDAALINHATIMNAVQLTNDDAKKATQRLVDSTYDIVRSSAGLVSNNILNDELVKSLVEKSNGTIVQHMTKVYLSGLSFLSYYNKLVSTSSFIHKLRLDVSKKYKDFYCDLMPHIHTNDLSLERVFCKGMSIIPANFLNDWAVGFLIHDIGKAPAIEYHEGENAYNRDIVVEHVKVGYTSIINKTNYPREAALIAGYHHEYYGDSAGYGFFRAHLKHHKETHPYARQDFSIAYELDQMLNFKAKAYFPAKILEIIDVFDSITDPNRKYRKHLSPQEAIAMMREEFIEKHRKIDPILFDIFAAYIREKENFEEVPPRGYGGR